MILGLCSCRPLYANKMNCHIQYHMSPSWCIISQKQCCRLKKFSPCNAHGVKTATGHTENVLSCTTEWILPMRNISLKNWKTACLRVSVLGKLTRWSNGLPDQVPIILDTHIQPYVRVWHAYSMYSIRFFYPLLIVIYFLLNHVPDDKSTERAIAWYIHDEIVSDCKTKKHAVTR